ncbi:MAG: hypothetical protein QM831_18320 [Kofleriaceae bacterium]
MKKLLLPCVVGCSGSDAVGTQLQDVMIAPDVPSNQLDLLFVIDDSPSMLDKQIALRASFPHMMDQLASLPNGIPDLHIAVVTSDMGTSALASDPAPAIPGDVGGCHDHGDNGAFRTDPSITGNFITTAPANYTGSLPDAFSAITQVGAEGCGFEQTLASMQQALSPTAPATNAGFLRPNANLGIVIISDEDDCSVEDSTLLSHDTTFLGPLQSFRCTRYGVICDDNGATTDDMNNVGDKARCHANESSTLVAQITPFADTLKALKADPAQVMVAALVGPTEPVSVVLQAPGGGSPIPALGHSCSFAGAEYEEVADPAIRLTEFAHQFPARNAVESVCSNDLSLPLTDIGITTRQMMGDTCTTANITDACTVTDGGAAVPKCVSTEVDCWELVTDATCTRLSIRRSQAPDPAAFTHVACPV